MDRPDIGHGIAGVLELVADQIRSRVGIETTFEPFPAETRTIHLDMVPRTFDVNREERRRMNLHDLYTVMLNIDVFLKGSGSGVEFMAEVMEGALVVARLFNMPLSVSIGGDYHATLSCTRRDAGTFIQSSDEGSQDYSYVEPWEGALLFPYVFEADSPEPVVLPPGLWPVTVIESP